MKVKTNQDAQLKRELEHDWDHMKDTITLIDPKDQAQVVVGEIPILEFTNTEEKEVKASLQELCKQLETALNTRYLWVIFISTSVCGPKLVKFLTFAFTRKEIQDMTGS